MWVVVAATPSARRWRGRVFFSFFRLPSRFLRRNRSSFSLLSLLCFSSFSLSLARALLEPSGSGAAASSAPTKRSTVNGGGGSSSGRGGGAAPGSAGAASTTSSSASASASRRKKLKQPKPSLFQRFAQQELSGWSPIITPRGLVAYFLVAGVLCAAAGGALLAATLSVVEASARYDNAGPFGAADAATASAANAARQALLASADGNGVNLTVDIPITRDMRPPVRSCSSFF